jgi:hypothetical protein
MCFTHGKGSSFQHSNTDCVQLLPRRRLSEAAADPKAAGQQVAQVSTFQELLDAWSTGTAHIELVNHLDSAGYPLQSADIGGKAFAHVLPPQKPSTRTVTVCFVLSFYLSIGNNANKAM